MRVRASGVSTSMDVSTGRSLATAVAVGATGVARGVLVVASLLVAVRVRAFATSVVVVATTLTTKKTHRIHLLFLSRIGAIR